MSGHTPGPWRQGSPLDAVVSDSPTCRDYLTRYTSDDEREHYGGYLIAESIAPQDRALIIAAPDLLAACKLTLERLFSEGMQGGKAALEAAVAKAEERMA